MAAGRFIEPLPVDSADELGQLTRAFNEMQVQLRRVDVARKEFVATASHELRTPIFSLGGFVELLRDEELDDETRREFLDTMAEQVERLQKLAVDLLDLSRLDAGSVELEREPVDLSELARAVTGEFRPAVARHETELELHLPARVRADVRPGTGGSDHAYPARQCAPPHPGGHSRDGVTRGARNGAARLTVTDRGPGLPDDAARSFERFYTGDATRGAGLGLAIARELAERMDGSLRSRLAGAGLDLHARAAGATPGGRRLMQRSGLPRAAAPRPRSPASRWPWRRPAATAATSARQDSDSTPQEVTTTRVQVVEGLGQPRAGSTPAQLYDRLAPGVVTIDLALRRRRRGVARARTAARAARDRASCSTATATSPPTRTWSPTASPPTRQAREAGLRRVLRRQPRAREDRRRRPERRRGPAQDRSGRAQAHPAAARQRPAT